MIRRKSPIPQQQLPVAGLSSPMRGQRTRIPSMLYGAKSTADTGYGGDVVAPPQVQPSKPFGALGTPPGATPPPSYGPATGAAPVSDPTGPPRSDMGAGGFPMSQTSRYPAQDAAAAAPPATQAVGTFGWQPQPVAPAQTGAPRQPKVPGTGSYSPTGGQYRPFPGLGGMPRLK